MGVWIRILRLMEWGYRFRRCQRAKAGRDCGQFYEDVVLKRLAGR